MNSNQKYLDNIKNRLPNELKAGERLVKVLEYASLWLKANLRHSSEADLSELASLLIRYRAHVAGIFEDSAHLEIQDALLEKIKKLVGLDDPGDKEPGKIPKISWGQLTEVVLDDLPKQLVQSHE